LRNLFWDLNYAGAQSAELTVDHLLTEAFPEQAKRAPLVSFGIVGGKTLSITLQLHDGEAKVGFNLN
jgi:hypothetical protein